MPISARALAPISPKPPLCSKHCLPPVDCSGIGVHSGEKVTLHIKPAPIDSGITFVRTDITKGSREIPARWDHVIRTELCTVIGNKAGVEVGTIEHLMAALHAYGVTNAVIEIDGPEVPIMDGSSDAFVFLLEMAGVVLQNASRKMIEILSPIKIEYQGKSACLSPALESTFSCDIDFGQAPINRQSYDFTLSLDNFKSELSRARTFCTHEEYEKMRAIGLARGGSLDNAVYIQDQRVMNADGLRYWDEFVRHKTLDAVGDMSLAGAPIRGHYHSSRPGHALNNRLLRALFADTSAWRYVTDSDQPSAGRPFTQSLAMTNDGLGA